MNKAATLKFAILKVPIINQNPLPRKRLICHHLKL